MTVRLSAKGMAINQLVIFLLGIISILVFSLVMMHHTSIRDRHAMLGDCSYAQCQALSLPEIEEAMRCPDIAVVSKEDIGKEEMSYLAEMLLNNPDSYVYIDDCDFSKFIDTEGKPLIIFGNSSGFIPAGRTLDITRIGNTVFVCVKEKCERKEIEKPTDSTTTTIPRISFDYAEKSGIYLAYHTNLPASAREWKYVQGARIFATWSDLQPTENDFRCDVIKRRINEIAAADGTAGRKLNVYIDLAQGTRKKPMPRWVSDKVPVSKCKNTYGYNFPIYWSEQYKGIYKNFIDKLSDCIERLPEKKRKRIAYVRANLWAYDLESLSGGLNEHEMVSCSSKTQVELPRGIPYPGTYSSDIARQYMYEIVQYYKEKIYDRFGIPVTSKAFEANVRNPIGEMLVRDFDNDDKGLWFYYTNANPSPYMITCAYKFRNQWYDGSSILEPCPPEHAKRAIKDYGTCAQFYCLVRNGMTIGTSEAIGFLSQDPNNLPSLVYWTELAAIHLRDAFLGLYETRTPSGSVQDDDLQLGLLDFMHEIYTNATKVYYTPDKSNFSLIAFRDYYCPERLSGPVHEYEPFQYKSHDYDTRTRGGYSLFIKEIKPERYGRYLSYYSLGMPIFCRGISSASGVKSIGKVQFCGDDICKIADSSRDDFEMVWAKSTRRLDGSGGRLYLDVNDVFASSIRGDVKLKVYYLCQPGNDFKIIYKSTSGNREVVINPSSCTSGYFTWDETTLQSPVFDNSLDEGADIIIDDNGSGNILHMVFMDKRA